LGEKRRENILLGEQVVLDMCEDYAGKCHHMYFINIFSDAKLTKMVLEK
jgi:hypothetical protein